MRLALIPSFKELTCSLISTHLESVSVGEGLAAHLAVQRLVGRVQLLDVEAQVGLPAAGRRAELALEDGLVASVDEAVRLQRVALREPRVADVALVGLLARVDAEVALQLEGVRGGVGAVRALVGPLPRVATHVPLQLRQLHAAVVALGAPEMNISQMHLFCFQRCKRDPH